MFHVYLILLSYYKWDTFLNFFLREYTAGIYEGYFTNYISNRGLIIVRIYKELHIKYQKKKTTNQQMG